MILGIQPFYSMFCTSYTVGFNTKPWRSQGVHGGCHQLCVMMRASCLLLHQPSHSWRTCDNPYYITTFPKNSFSSLLIGCTSYLLVVFSKFLFFKIFQSNVRQSIGVTALFLKAVIASNISHHIPRVCLKVKVNHHFLDTDLKWVTDEQSSLQLV